MFSAGEWTFDRERIVRALSDDERFEIALIVIDEYRRSIWKRARFLLRVWGPWKLAASVLASLAHKIVRPVRRTCFAAGTTVSSLPCTPNGIRVERPGLPRRPGPRHQCAGDRSSCVIDAAPDLGIILGGRILKSALIDAPRLGTLNIHKHDVRRYRGGAEIGYPEILNADRELGTHHPLGHGGGGCRRGGGDRQRPGADLRHHRKPEAEGRLRLDRPLRRRPFATVAAERTQSRRRRPSRSGRCCTRRRSSTGSFRSERSTGSGAASPGAEATLGLSPLRVRTVRAVRTGMAYAALPYLKMKREQLAAQGRAPVVIFYYHGISNAAENWMTLDLVSFHRQIEYLRRYFDILPLDAAVAALRAGTRRRPAVVLTFDDGYASALRRTPALPEGARIAGDLLCVRGRRGRRLHVEARPRSRIWARAADGRRGLEAGRRQRLRDRLPRIRARGHGDARRSPSSAMR